MILLFYSSVYLCNLAAMVLELRIGVIIINKRKIPILNKFPALSLFSTSVHDIILLVMPPTEPTKHSLSTGPQSQPVVCNTYYDDDYEEEGKHLNE